MKVEYLPVFTKISITLETLEEVQIMFDIARYASGENIPIEEIQPLARVLRNSLKYKIE